MIVQAQGYVWGPVGAVGTVVGGTGYAVGEVFTGAGMIVEGVVGGVLGGVAALFGSPPPSSYAYGAPFAAPFNGAGTVAVAPSRRWVALSERRSPTPSTEPLPATPWLDRPVGQIRGRTHKLGCDR